MKWLQYHYIPINPQDFLVNIMMIYDDIGMMITIGYSTVLIDILINHIGMMVFTILEYHHHPFSVAITFKCSRNHHFLLVGELPTNRK